MLLPASGRLWPQLAECPSVHCIYSTPYKSPASASPTTQIGEGGSAVYSKAAEAMRALIEGNQRFVSGDIAGKPTAYPVTAARLPPSLLQCSCLQPSCIYQLSCPQTTCLDAPHRPYPATIACGFSPQSRRLLTAHSCLICRLRPACLLSSSDVPTWRAQFLAALSGGEGIATTESLSDISDEDPMAIVVTGSEVRSIRCRSLLPLGLSRTRDAGHMRGI